MLLNEDMLVVVWTKVTVIVPIIAISMDISKIAIILAVVGLLQKSIAYT